MMRAAGDYEGDLVADELRAPSAFAATLARPIVYVRGPFGSFGSTAGIADTASIGFSVMSLQEHHEAIGR